MNGPAFVVETGPSQRPAPLDGLIALREQPSRLLAARRQAIQFTGRSAELADIRTWRNGPEQRSAWLIHAAGGQGKTRLAARAGEEAAMQGWTVGYARHHDDSPIGGDPVPAGDVPLLLIVDYAERWPQSDLHKLLRYYAVQDGPLRILLLARSIDWWPVTAVECDNLDISIDGRWPPRLLQPLADDQAGRRILFDAACDRFAEIYQVDDLPVLTPAGQLSDPIYGLTLSLHMAALAAVHAQTYGEDPPQTAADLSRYLLDRERRYWSKLHGEQSVTAAARTVFIAALAGPQSVTDGVALLEHTGLPQAADTSAQKLLDGHARCYPPSIDGLVLEPLYPDRLAEDFIALTLPGPQPTGHADVWAANLITSAHNDGGQLRHQPGQLFTREPPRPSEHLSRALIYLAASATHSGHTAERLRLLLQADPALAMNANGVALVAITPYLDLSLAVEIGRHLPDGRVDLYPAAAALAEHVVSLIPMTAPPEHRAPTQSILSSTLARAGRWKEALKAAENAVAIYRQLTDANSDHIPELALALDNLGNRLADVGRQEDALSAAQESVTIYRQLADANEAYLPNLAMALNNLAASLAELGRWKEALTKAEEAVEVYRQHANTDTTHLRDFAMALSNLGNSLSGMGRREEALAVARQAVDIHRRPAMTNPAYLPDLALALNNLGVGLAEVGHWEEALTTAEESVKIHRQLADANPDHIPELAMALNNLGGRLIELGRREEALVPTQEAVTIRRELAKVNPAVHQPKLAMALNNLGSVLAALGRQEEALASTQEAVAINRELATANPTAHLPDLARALTNLCGNLAAADRWEEALDTAAEAVATYRQLPETGSAAHLPGLASSLMEHARICAKLKMELPAALTAATQSITIYQALAEQLPRIFNAHLIAACLTFAEILDCLGQNSEAAQIRQIFARAGENWVQS
ncbi:MULTISPECIES: tetratricopeptide repeat protein [Micromonospora]|uniref:tetratricopeptide repeat protein n=1 Tax=Micromonospora TaxID=1873 RepID=UPI001304ACA7|nr:tetratricopeptide repeat protein [Verrucosispora sp. ts21]